MYKVKVNSKYTFDISGAAGTFQVNGQETEIDVQPLRNGKSAHILYEKKSYNIQILEVSEEEKTQTIRVNGNTYTVAIEDKYDILLKQLGLVKAPMPGLVLNVMVEEGDEVKKGDSLLVLEAMKMENILKSTTNGIVSKIFVAKGDKTEKNAVLIQFK
jgi:biotin carboxyl carrier protein